MPLSYAFERSLSRVISEQNYNVPQVRRDDGIGIDGLAAEFDISRRSVFRILARGQARESAA